MSIVVVVGGGGPVYTQYEDTYIVACAQEVGDLRITPHKASAYENVRATSVPRHQLYRRLRFRLVSMRFSLVSMWFSLVSGLRCMPCHQLLQKFSLFSI
jgi:hypothetical protein